MVAAGQTFRACSLCGVVCEHTTLPSHREECEGNPEATRSTKLLKKRKQTPAFAEGSRKFLRNIAEGFDSKAFTLLCDCVKCKFVQEQKKLTNASADEHVEAFTQHFRAVPARKATEVRELEERALQGESELREAKLQVQEVEKEMEARSNELREQLQINQALVQETDRLNRELASQIKCVICRDSTPSKAFQPCGHVCVCGPCWDTFKQREQGMVCPTCRGCVQFVFSVYI
eukprot:Skav208261  [mRNA]  locus=scaffold188:51880:52575:+ [translate_table: standard]